MARLANGQHQRAGRCKRCGRPASDTRPISRRGNCPPCGKAALSKNMTGMVHRRGPYYNHWIERMTDAVNKLASERR